MDIGQVVALVKDVEGVATKVPALVTKVYENVHGEVVADLHELEATVKGVISADDNPPEALPPGGLSVTSDLTTPPVAAAPAADDAAVTGAEAEVAAMSTADKAKFYAWLAEQEKGTGAPS